jgi:hypothetical protein
MAAVRRQLKGDLADKAFPLVVYDFSLSDERWRTLVTGFSQRIRDLFERDPYCEDYHILLASEDLLRNWKPFAEVDAALSREGVVRTLLVDLFRNAHRGPESPSAEEVRKFLSLLRIHMVYLTERRQGTRRFLKEIWPLTGEDVPEKAETGEGQSLIVPGGRLLGW